MTDLDYSLGRSKYGESVIGGDGYHGPSTAKLSIEGKGRSIKIIVSFDDPIPLEVLDDFTFWVKPDEGNGKIKTEILLDGDGDGKCVIKNPADAKLYNSTESWDENGWEEGSWTDLDASFLNYKKSKDKGLGDLDYWQPQLRGKSVVKIYLHLYGYGPGKNTCYFDYIKIGDQVISFEPLEDEEAKKGKPSRLSPGRTITYTITYGNNLFEPVEDLVVTESYDPRTVFVEAYPPPDPGTNNVWTVGRLAPGEHGQIFIKMKTLKQKIYGDMTSKVSGVGYSSVRGKITTAKEGYYVTNRATIRCKQFDQTATETTLVKPVSGISVAFEDHGSGFYNSSEWMRYSSSRIDLDREVLGSHGPTVVFLGRDRPLSHNNTWYASHTWENEMRDTYLRDRYLYGREINVSDYTGLRSTRSILNTEAGVEGMAELEKRWKDSFVTEVFVGNFSVQSRTEVIKRRS